MLYNLDSLEFLKKQDDYSIDINYSDPPYALGSEVIIRQDGKVDYSKANDFMSKWEMPTGKYWDKWFKEAYRSLKYGGYCIMFGMDRQLLLFKYYASLAGFQERQSLYWFFISNFPKSSNLANNIAKRDGAKRDGAKRDGAGTKGNTFKVNSQYQEYNLTPLAEKYQGYHYSISPLKQTNETIMIFQKPYKTGSCLHDTLACENGDRQCLCGALNIDGNRIPCKTKSQPHKQRNSGTLAGCGIDEKIKYGKSKFPEGDYGESNFRNDERQTDLHPDSRYPAQTFIESGTKKLIREPSKILQCCDFEKDEHDLYFYCPKVNSNERNAGLEQLGNRTLNRMREDKGEATGLNKEGRFAPIQTKNPHPTLKPISLNEKILKLFKTPIPQRIIYPFAGSGSEVIGGYKAGFEEWSGCELNPEYCQIAIARIKHWTDIEPQLECKQCEEHEETNFEVCATQPSKELEKEVIKEFKNICDCGGRIVKIKSGRCCEDCMKDY